MENKNKGKLFAAVAGAVVGAGAVVATALALKDKSNQKKLQEIVKSAKDIVKGSKQSVSDEVQESKENIKKLATKAIDTADKVTKSAKKRIKNI